jgi:uncharacterized protein (TIGR01244 family)
MIRTTVVLAIVVAVVLVGCAGDPAAEPKEVTVAQAAPVDPLTLVRNGMMPFEGVLTGGQPTDEQFAALREAGFQTVINLRMPDERGTKGEPEKIAELGMRYVSIPVDGKAGLNEENAAALAAALDEADRPVLVHCGSGNRVGALLAVKAFWLDGASAEEALEIGLAGGVTRLEPMVRELLGLAD